MSKHTNALNEAKAIGAEVTQCLEKVRVIGRTTDMSSIEKHLTNMQAKLEPVCAVLSEGARGETRKTLEEEPQQEPTKDDPPRKKGKR